MKVPLAARSLCARILSSLMEASDTPDLQPALATTTPLAEFSEFESLLSDLGSEPSSPGQQDNSILKDAMIAELTARLQDLQTLGDQLAATEQERLLGVARIAELEAACAASQEKTLAVDECLLEKKIASLTRARERETARLDRMRDKFEERHRVAAERWRELLELRRELKALKRAS